MQNAVVRSERQHPGKRGPRGFFDSFPLLVYGKGIGDENDLADIRVQLSGHHDFQEVSQHFRVEAHRLL